MENKNISKNSDTLLTTKNIILNCFHTYGYTEAFLLHHGYKLNDFYEWQYTNSKRWKELVDLMKKENLTSVFSLLQEMSFIRKILPHPPKYIERDKVTKNESDKNNKNISIQSINEDFCKQFNQNLEFISRRLKSKDKKNTGCFSLKNKFQKKRALNLILSDLHLHSLLDEREVPFKYGEIEEARRLAAVISATIHYKTHYRDETVLHVHLLGDIIQNMLHDPRDGAPLAEQAAAAVSLLTQAIEVLSLHFLEVHIHCTSGNHGRNVARHPNRAITQKWDSIENIVYYSIKMACADLSNVKFGIGYKPYYDCKIFDHWMFMTHGDTVINPGNPSKSINVTNIRKQINEINATAPQGKRYNLFACGHIHTASQTHLPGKCVFLTNGALVPPDSYAISLGIMDSTCGMWLFETTEKYVFGDSRLIIVDEEDDNNKSWDALIKPFSSL